MENSPNQIVTRVFTLLENCRELGYYGEAVTQLEHALQAAHLAESAGADAELTIAALLHDIGHLLEEQAEQLVEGLGVIDHDRLGARTLRQWGFSVRVASLVEGHVDAKRYLTAANPAYRARLSPVSTQTLALQGGPMSAEEVASFEGDPHFRDKLRLRSWDEQAKVPGAQVPGLDTYRPLLLRHLEAQKA